MQKPSKRYAIETRFLGPEEDAIWKGWAVTRMYPSARIRDEALRHLQSIPNPVWQYRAKGQ